MLTISRFKMDTTFLTKLIDELVQVKVENTLLKQKPTYVNSEIKCTKDILDETVELKMKIKELEKVLDEKTTKIVTLEEKCKQYREHIEQYASSYLNINVDEMITAVEDNIEESLQTDDEKETVVSVSSSSNSVKNIIVNTNDSTSKDRKAYMREYMREKRKKNKK